MTVVQNQLTDAAGIGTSGWVTVRLVGPGLRPATQSEILVEQTVQTASDGTWQLDLSPNSTEAPYYVISEQALDRRAVQHVISVLDSPNPVWLGDIIVQIPLPLSEAGAPYIGPPGPPGPPGSMAFADLLLKWKPNTVYAAGDYVLSPAGQVMSAIAPFTSGTTYDPANWTPAVSAEQIPFSATGILASNVRDALLEILGLADDAGEDWSNVPKLLNLNAGVFVTDTDLNVSIAAGQAMRLDYYYTFSGATSATANLRAQLQAPSGATAKWGSALDWNAAGSAGTAKGSLAALTDMRTFKLNTAPTGIHIRAIVVNGSSDGTVSIQLAPDTTTASAVIRDAWSGVEYRRAQ